MQEKELLFNISKSFKELSEFFEKLAGEEKKESFLNHQLKNIRRWKMPCA